jgi:hypothetical protein
VTRAAAPGRAVAVGVTIAALLAGCGAQSHVASVHSLTPAQAKRLVRAFRPGCNVPGRVLVRYVEPEVHGKGGESWWCVEPAKAYSVVGRSLRCPAHTRLHIDFRLHVAGCGQSGRLRAVLREGIEIK